VGYIPVGGPPWFSGAGHPRIGRRVRLPTAGLARDREVEICRIVHSFCGRGEVLGPNRRRTGSNHHKTSPAFAKAMLCRVSIDRMPGSSAATAPRKPVHTARGNQTQERSIPRSVLRLRPNGSSEIWFTPESARSRRNSWGGRSPRRVHSVSSRHNDKIDFGSAGATTGGGVHIGIRAVLCKKVTKHGLTFQIQ